MTDREKAIVMAYTGACMLTGDKFQIFHKYVEEIMGRPVQTIEMGFIADEIKEKSKDDFMSLCADEGSSEKLYKWTPVKEGKPVVGQDVEVCDIDEDIYITYLHTDGTWGYDNYGCKIKNVVAWRELSEPYRVESEGKE